MSAAPKSMHDVTPPEKPRDSGGTKQIKINSRPMLDMPKLPIEEAPAVVEKKEPTPMEKLTEGYESFIKGKKANSDGKELFDKVLKKVVKQRAVK